MGQNEKDELILVEQQPPFSCGWYGQSNPDANARYTRWLAYGWDYLKNLTMIDN